MPDATPGQGAFAGWPPSQPKTCTRCGKRVLAKHNTHISTTQTPKGEVWRMEHLGECP